LFAAIALFQAFRDAMSFPLVITPFLYFSKRIAAYGSSAMMRIFYMPAIELFREGARKKFRVLVEY